MDAKKKKTNLSSVGNTLCILNCFTVEQPEKRVTDIARELDLGKSTVSRLLATLASEGYVKKNPETQKFSLGLRLLSLASTLTSNLEIVREARPVLQQLVQETSESAQIAEIEGNRMIYVDQVKCKQPIRILAHIGRINPIHCTGSGRLLLAYQSEKRQQELLHGELMKYTPNTETDPVKIQKDLETIKNQGYCIITNELIEGVVSISAPIRDYRERVISAISVVGPLNRLTEEKIIFCRNRVQKAGREISKKMGCISEYFI
ncbi:IclR family transcriptional regulator [Acetobacterium bakii]|uniref:Glycerol operon regulatory protein n=1 Tax=Acetobacterium bakii TaxID=52689 RepID=A0A0L6TZC7_9FIRM|nr:IclR family transcriptional regulator [Acetobacterium bakii]KNZ40905.1 IclR family transcriptional regulator [Acetobacterium bakii]